MRYEAFDKLAGRPNVVVDGPSIDGTVLVLSHWVGSGSPDDLAADLSTEIVFRFLERGVSPGAELVSNNHFDEDGLSGIYALTQPDEALRRRTLIEDVASAGDFGVYRDRRAARIVFTLFAFGDPERSPLGPEPFEGPYERTTEVLYSELLARYPEMLDDVDRFRALWEDEDARLERDEQRIDSGAVTIEEHPALDLAVVRVNDGVDAGTPDLGCHRFAIHSRTGRHRILVTNGSRHELRFRYETWVRFVSRPTSPRIDLGPLAAELTGAETAGALWRWDGVDGLTPAVSLADGAESSLTADRFIEAATRYLRAGAATVV